MCATPDSCETEVAHSAIFGGTLMVVKSVVAGEAIAIAAMFLSCRVRPVMASVPQQWEYCPETLRSLRQELSFSNGAGDQIALFGLVDADPSSKYRWSKDRAVFRFWPIRSEDSLFKVTFHVVEATLEDTGPITITAALSPSQKVRQKYSRSGSYELSLLIPTSAVREDAPLLIEFAVTPPWIAPSDGEPLGVLLQRASLESASRVLFDCK